MTTNHIPATDRRGADSDLWGGSGAGSARAAQPVKLNNFALPAMIVGIIALAGSAVVVGGLVGIVGLALGVVALRSSEKTGEGRGFALTAIFTSSASLVISVVMVFVAIWFAHKTQDCYHYRQVGQWLSCVRHEFS